MTFWQEYRKGNLTFVPLELIFGITGFIVLTLFSIRDGLMSILSLDAWFPWLAFISGFGMFITKYYSYKNKLGGKLK